MSTIKATFASKCLARPTDIYVVLPDQNPPPGSSSYYQRPAKTLLLLHGYSGIATDWLLNAPAQPLAAKYNLAIVTVSGENSFYLDQKGTGRKYGTFVGEEVLEYVRNTFKIALNRQDTFVGGLSMGGFGALRTAFAYPENFSGCIALSSALIHNQVMTMTPDNTQGAPADYDYYASTFGEPSQLAKSVNNPEFLVKKLKADGKEMPKIFMACGTEDSIMVENRRFRDFLLSENVRVKFQEAPGIHNWDFWCQHIGPGIEYLLGSDV